MPLHYDSMWKRLFGKAQEPAPEPPSDLIRRLMISNADVSAVNKAVHAYAEVMSGRCQIAARVLGPEAGWLIVDLPASVHPYYFHNLGSWFEPGCQVVTSSWSAQDPWHYVLLEEATPSDYLLGVQQDGQALTIGRPAHIVLRSEEVSSTWTCVADILAEQKIPLDFAFRPSEGFASQAAVMLAMEDFGDDLNPGLQTTHKRRPNYQPF